VEPLGVLRLNSLLLKFENYYQKSTPLAFTIAIYNSYADEYRSYTFNNNVENHELRAITSVLSTS